MATNVWKGITFAEGYNKPFAEFKVEFEQMQDFKNIPSAERLNALKEAHKTAIKGNGNTSGTTNKSKEDSAENPAE